MAVTDAGADATDRRPDLKLAVLLLCHEEPARIAQLLSLPFFHDAGVKVYVHYDARQGSTALAQLQAAVPGGVQCAFVENRVACSWGDYSLVEATHRMLRMALADHGFQCDYAALASASCIPIRPWSSLREFLRRRRGIDFIQAVDISQRRWVKGGLEQERCQYYFPLNFKRHQVWFDRLTQLQRLLRVRRRAPGDLRIHMGSQWFCLTRETAERVSTRLLEPAVKRFFSLCWIPDECAIQSLVAQVQKPERIAGHTLTYHEFDKDGRPLVLENDHLEHLLNQPFFFARKVSPHATGLLREIEDHLKKPELDLSYFERAGQPTSTHLRHQWRALTLPAARTRVGATSDEWRGPMLGNERRYYVLHGASRAYMLDMMRRVRASGDRLPAFDFVFDPLQLEPAAEAPSWRGFQVGMRPRRDHDPAGFLYELVNVDEQLPTAFCLDAAVPQRIRELVLCDPNAVVLLCEPAGMGKYQRAEAALAGLRLHAEDELFEATLRAVPVQAWLPQDFFEQAARDKKHACRIARFGELAETADPMLAALRQAWQGMPALDHFAPSEEQAWQRIYHQPQPRSAK
jgi:hypothetical protein